MRYDTETFELESAFEFEAETSGAAPMRWVQAALNKVLGLKLAVDGIAGPATRSAIRTFQQRKGLTADGIVGPNTEKALVAAGAPPRDASTSAVVVPSSTCPATSKFVDCPPPGGRPDTILEQFAFDNAALVPARHGPQIIALARRIIASLGSRQPVRTILVAGHTDAVGTDDYNFALARRRAENAAQELCRTVERMRPGAMRAIGLELTSCGERQTKSAAQDSRRVEIFLKVAPRPRPPRPRPVPPKVPPKVPPELERLLKIVERLLNNIPLLGKLGVKVPTTLRFLNADEQREAATMFGRSLDFSRILISDGLGVQGRPFTVAAPAASKTFVVMNLGDVLTWHTKPRSFDLIHELTHAWQSQHHSTSPSAFMENSVKCQALALADIPVAKAEAGASASAAAVAKGTLDPIKLAAIAKAAAAAEDCSAYAYVPGKIFGRYAAEQIAQQVEDAYRGRRGFTPNVPRTVKAAAMNAPVADNDASMNTISFARKSTPGVLFR